MAGSILVEDNFLFKNSKVGCNGTLVNNAETSNEINLCLEGLTVFKNSIKSLLWRKCASEKVPRYGDSFLANHLESLYDGEFIFEIIGRKGIYLLCES